MRDILRLFTWIIAGIYSLFQDKSFYKNIDNSSNETFNDPSLANDKTQDNSPNNSNSKIVWGIVFVVGIALLIFAIALGKQEFIFFALFVNMFTVIISFIKLSEPSSSTADTKTVKRQSQETTKSEASFFEDGTVTGVFEIRLPVTSQWDSELALNLIYQLIYIGWGLELMIEGTKNAITWKICVEGSINLDFMERLIYSNYPDAQLRLLDFDNENVDTMFADAIYPMYRTTWQYKLANEFVAPLRYVRDISHNDPLAAISQSMAGLREGEVMRYVLRMAGGAEDAYKRGEMFLTESTIHPLQYLSGSGIRDAVNKHLSGTNRTTRFIGEEQRVMEGKLKQILINVALCVQVDSPEYQRSVSLAAVLDSQMRFFMREPYNLLYCPNQSNPVEISDLSANKKNYYRSLWKNAPRLILEPREIAALWHLPHKGMKAGRIWKSKKHVSVPEGIARHQEGVRLGTGLQDLGQQVGVYLPYEDRNTHMSIIGKTGAGKSNLLHHIIHQDIANGHGVGVIDPHGDLVEKILAYSIPEERMKDVLLLDLADHDYPPPLNPANQGHGGLLGVINIIDRLFPETEEMARLSQTLRASIQLLRYEETPTLRDVTRILTDDIYRGLLLSRCDVPEIRDYWNFQYNNQKVGFRNVIAEPIINRIRPFYGNSFLYPVICHPKRIDFDMAVAEKKIVLISLDMDEADVPKQERDLLGAMLTSRLQAAGMKRRNQKANTGFYLYIDEVQRFSTSSLDTIFSEARKYNLSLTVAHQYLEQLEGSLLQSILGNVGTTVVFRSNPSDTSKLALHMQPEFSRGDLVSLDRFQAAVKMQHWYETQPSFVLYPDPPIEAEQNSEEARLAKERAQIIRKFAISNQGFMARQDVLAWLSKHYGDIDNPSSPPPANPDAFVE